MILKALTVDTVTEIIIQSARKFGCWSKEFIVVHVNI